MYQFLEMVDPRTNKVFRQIFVVIGGVHLNFPDIESNLGPERATYLAWLAEGNIPEPWNPEEQ